ncbi:MAG: hypothetical protein IAF00_07395 [Phycisphaerales bacterium]|nr:hypothetical protein [Phycisphaerales bacterium]
MKLRHILFLLLVLSAIAFMEPLVTFLGGLALLLGVGALIYRDLPSTAQDAVDRWMLSWLHRTRLNPAAEGSPLTFSSKHLPTTSSEIDIPTERVRRVRTKPVSNDSAVSTPPRASSKPNDDLPAA